MTPVSFISIQRSLPSRVRSPTPAKTATPPWLRLMRADEFLQQDGLADAGAADQPGLAAPRQWAPAGR